MNICNLTVVIVLVRKTLIARLCELESPAVEHNKVDTLGNFLRCKPLPQNVAKLALCVRVCVHIAGTCYCVCVCTVQAHAIVCVCVCVHVYVCVCVDQDFVCLCVCVCDGNVMFVGRD